MEEPPTDDLPAAGLTQPVEGEGTVLKCAIPGCRDDQTPLVMCSNHGCSRHVHRHCFHFKCVGTKGLEDLPNSGAACTQKCHNVVIEKTSRRLGWNEDAKDEVSKSSEQIPLEWMLTPGDCAKFRGKDNKGATKKQCAKAISAQIARAGALVPRDEKAVLNKIKCLEDSFRKAHAFANAETGAGLKADDPEGSFKEAVERHCPNHFDLPPVMGDRAGAKPKATTDDLLDSSSDEEEEEGTEGTGPPEVIATAGNEEENGKKTAASKSTATSAKKKKKSPPSTTSAASSKRGGFSPLDDETAESVKAASESKKEMHEVEKKEKELDHKFKKLETLANARRKCPNMTEEHTRHPFPELGDLLDIDTSNPNEMC